MESSQGNCFVGGGLTQMVSEISPKYSHFGPIERYISETVQDRRHVIINHW